MNRTKKCIDLLCYRNGGDDYGISDILMPEIMAFA